MFKKDIYFGILSIFVYNSLNAQCAMCKAVVENGNKSLAEGVNNGITYLMIFPYLLIAALFFFIYNYRKKSKN